MRLSLQQTFVSTDPLDWYLAKQLEVLVHLEEHQASCHCQPPPTFTQIIHPEQTQDKPEPMGDHWHHLSGGSLATDNDGAVLRVNIP